MKKIKWKNVFKILIFMFCISMILLDFYYIIFKFATLTWIGLLTHILLWVILGMIYEDFEEQIKSIPSYKPKHAKDTTRK